MSYEKDADLLEMLEAERRRAEQSESAYASARLKISEQDKQIKDLQKQVVRACELRMIADRRAARRNVYGLQDRIRKLEEELVRVWHRSSGVELKKLEARLHEQADRITELESELENVRGRFGRET